MTHSAIKTPHTHPDHETVGHHFVGGCWHCDAKWHVYYCDSYDPRIGFWMTRADCPPSHITDEQGEWRKNVSDRAICRTFHRIYDYGGLGVWSQWGSVDRNLLLVPAAFISASQPAE